MPRRSPPRRLRRLLVVALLLQAALVLARVSVAQATTHISAIHYTSNTTWTTAGSPYVLDGDVHVDSGVTLTINPGVIVKFNGSTRSLWVNGTLSASGTSGNRIVFTSYQDDSAGGDTNGDGTSTGTAGQWYGIEFMSGSSGTFDYADVRFGGSGASGSGSYADGVIHTQGSTTSVSVDHSTLDHNSASGLQNGGGTTTVAHTTSSNNGTGLSVDNGVLTVSGNSSIHDNSYNGIFMNMAGWTGTASTVNHSAVFNNGSNGLKLQVDAWTPDASTPNGEGNNIYGNSGKQLWALRSMPNTDWEYNTGARGRTSAPRGKSSTWFARAEVRPASPRPVTFRTT